MSVISGKLFLKLQQLLKKNNNLKLTNWDRKSSFDGLLKQLCVSVKSRNKKSNLRCVGETHELQPLGRQPDELRRAVWVNKSLIAKEQRRHFSHVSAYKGWVFKKEWVPSLNLTFKHRRFVLLRSAQYPPSPSPDVSFQRQSRAVYHQHAKT